MPTGKTEIEQYSGNLLKIFSLYNFFQIAIGIIHQNSPLSKVEPWKLLI